MRVSTFKLDALTDRRPSVATKLSVMATVAIAIVAFTATPKAEAFGLSHVFGGASKVVTGVTSQFSRGVGAALDGAALGAIAGNLIGKDTKATLIGAGAGAVVGTLTDSYQQRQKIAPAAPQPRNVVYEGYADPNARTTKTLTTKRVIRNGVVVQETTQEVIKSSVSNYRR
jgi:hypothetical protein